MQNWNRLSGVMLMLKRWEIGGAKKAVLNSVLYSMSHRIKSWQSHNAQTAPSSIKSLVKRFLEGGSSSMSKVKLHIAFEMMLFDFNHQNASSSPIMHSICHTCGSLILLEMPDMTPCTSLWDDEWSLYYFFFYVIQVLEGPLYSLNLFYAFLKLNLKSELWLHLNFQQKGKCKFATYFVFQSVTLMGLLFSFESSQICTKCERLRYFWSIGCV